MRSNNPFLKANYSYLERSSNQAVMSANGTANKAAFLILIVFAGSIVGWGSALSGSSSLGTIGALAGFVLAILTSFKPHLASLTAPIYAVCEGLFLGSIAVWAENLYPGIASQAVMGTIGVFMVMMILYRTGIIRVTDKFRSIVTSLVFGIAATYLISIVVSLFTGRSVLFQGGLIGIIFSLIVITVAAFCLLLDFDSIEKAESRGQPKQMEWFYAFSLLITLVWLYLEIFRLLSILRSSE